MSRAMLATGSRVLQQLRYDHRTLALLLVVPVLLLTLLWWVLIDNEPAFQSVGPALLGIFPLISMFLVTSVATLRERRSGTLERLLAMPMRKADFVLGYGLAFGLLAIIQGSLAAGVGVWLLGLDIAGPMWFLVLIAVLNALVGMSLGLALSAFARTEFQAVQFMPAAVLPQLLLCGLIVPRDQMPDVLQWLSNIMPLTYATEALQQVARYEGVTSDGVRYALVLAGFVIGLLLLGSASLRRQTA